MPFLDLGTYEGQPQTPRSCWDLKVTSVISHYALEHPNAIDVMTIYTHTAFIDQSISRETLYLKPRWVERHWLRVSLWVHVDINCWCPHSTIFGKCVACSYSKHNIVTLFQVKRHASIDIKISHTYKVVHIYLSSSLQTRSCIFHFKLLHDYI